MAAAIGVILMVLVMLAAGARSVMADAACPARRRLRAVKAAPHQGRSGALSAPQRKAAARPDTRVSQGALPRPQHTASRDCLPSSCACACDGSVKVLDTTASCGGGCTSERGPPIKGQRDSSVRQPVNHIEFPAEGASPIT